MPKMKTKRAAAKRFKRMGSGKIKHQKHGRRHLLCNKSRKRKRQLGRTAYVHASEEKRMKQLLPYVTA